VAKTFAGVFFIVLCIVLINVWRKGGTPAVRSWFGAKFLNRPSAGVR
jgi:hypothetical protein